MPNKIRDDLLVVDTTSFPYIYEENVTIQLKSFDGLVRANVYRPKTDKKVPVLVTYGPYGKDIPYKEYVKTKVSIMCLEDTSTSLTGADHCCPAFCRNHGTSSIRSTNPLIRLSKPLTLDFGRAVDMPCFELMKSE